MTGRHMNIIESGYFFWILGFVIGQIYYLIDAPFFNEKPIRAFCYGVINLVVMMIGAKLMYIVENFVYVMQHGVGFQGFSLYGAIFFQLLSCALIFRIFKKDSGTVASFIVIPMILMLAFYRIDCLISGCCGGITAGGFKFPTQITESVFCLLLSSVFVALTHRKRLLRGQCFAWYFVIYGAFRFAIEFVRVRTNLFWVISLSHVWSLLAIAIGVLLILRGRARTDFRNDVEEV